MIMRRFLLIGIIMSCCMALSAQTAIDTSRVTLDRSHLFNRFYIDSTQLTVSQMAVACGANDFHKNAKKCLTNNRTGVNIHNCQQHVSACLTEEIAPRLAPVAQLDRATAF